MTDPISQIPDIPSELKFDHWNFLEKIKTSIKSIDADLTSHTHTFDWLSNVTCPIPDDNNVIRYNATTELWENVSPAAGLGLTDSAFKTITGITNDVIADAPHDTLILASANNKLSIVGTTATDTITFTINQGNIDHNALAGIQGGLAADYYHLTLTQHTDLTDGNDCSIHKHDDIYYTETELDAGQLDNRYFTETEHLDISAGAGDAGKPIKLDVAGHIDVTMLNDGDIDHTLITNIGVNTHVQIDTHMADGTKHFLEGSINHGSITGLGDSADHTWALLIDGTRTLTADWNIGNHKLGINIAPSYPLHIVSAPGDLDYNGVLVDFNPTGTLTVAREQNGLYIDVDSDVNRNGNAFLLKGFRTVVTDTGDASTVYGVQTLVEHSNVNTGTVLASLWGNLKIGQGSIDLAYGSRNRIRVFDTGAATSVYAMFGQVQMLAAAKTLGEAYGGRYSIEQTNGTITTGYLFYGLYSGTIGTKWGIYLTGETQSYLSGNLGLGVTPGAKLDVDSDIIRLRTAKTPASAGAAGNTGDICWDASNIYICVAASTWKKVAIATW